MKGFNHYKGNNNNKRIGLLKDIFTSENLGINF